MALVLSSAHLRDVLHIDSECVCALSVREDGCDGLPGNGLCKLDV